MNICECGTVVKSPKAVRCHACWNRVKAAERKVPINRAYFLARTHVEDGCWIWDGARVKSYGTTNKGTAHRLAYRTLVGLIPKDVEVSHLCGRSLCCNPDHLTVESHRANMARAPHIQAQTERTHCPRGHPYSGPNLRIFQGKRSCRACAAIHRDEYRARKKLASGTPAGESGDQVLGSQSESRTV